MKRKTGRLLAGLRRSVRTDAACRPTRRAFLLTAAAWPLLGWAGAVLAQSKQPVLIGWLNANSRESSGHRLAAFKEGLAALGWKDGSQFVIDERWADGRVERLPTLAAELATRKPAVIVAAPAPATAAVAKAAPETPIVHLGGDPVAPGLAASLAHPGGMVTGLTDFASGLSEKYLELLLAAAPRLKRIGFLLDPNSANVALHRENARRSVAQHSVEARFAEAGRPEDIEPALLRLAKEGAQALVVTPGLTFTAERRRIVKVAIARRWPSIGSDREWTEEGTLLSYGIDPAANYRRAAYYVDRILKGAKPGDLPIERPTKFELVINRKTAKTLGLVIPQSLLLRADRVIE